MHRKVYTHPVFCLTEVILCLLIHPLAEKIDFHNICSLRNECHKVSYCVLIEPVYFYCILCIFCSYTVLVGADEHMSGNGRICQSINMCDKHAVISMFCKIKLHIIGCISMLHQIHLSNTQ